MLIRSCPYSLIASAIFGVLRTNPVAGCITRYYNADIVITTTVLANSALKCHSPGHKGMVITALLKAAGLLAPTCPSGMWSLQHWVPLQPCDCIRCQSYCISAAFACPPFGGCCPRCYQDESTFLLRRTTLSLPFATWWWWLAKIHLRGCWEVRSFLCTASFLLLSANWPFRTRFFLIHSPFADKFIGSDGPSPITAIGGWFVFVALGSGPVFVFCGCFSCCLFCLVRHGSIRISDPGKCISTQRPTLALFDLVYCLLATMTCTGFSWNFMILPYFHCFSLKGPGDPMAQLVWRWSCQRWQTAGGGSNPCWSTRESQVRPAERQRAPTKKKVSHLKDRAFEHNWPHSRKKWDTR